MPVTRVTVATAIKDQIRASRLSNLLMSMIIKTVPRIDPIETVIIDSFALVYSTS